MEPEVKVSVLLRIPADKKLAFEDLYPWHGSLSQFFQQALEEFLKLAKDQKTPAQLTVEAVTNSYRKDW